MSGSLMMNDGIPAELSFSKGVRGLHHIPSNARVFVPASIEREVWEYFHVKAAQKGIGLSDLLSEILKRDMEVIEASK